MKRYLLFFIFVFFTVGLIKAQEFNHWPPDESAIFSENLQIVENYDSSTGWPQPESTAPVADNENRLIRVYDEATESWREFPYPDEIPMAYFSSQWGQNLYLSVASGEIYDYHSLIWRLDLDTGEFEIFEPCPNALVRDNEVSYARWVLATDKQTNEVFLCDYQNRERITASPDENSYWISLRVTPQEDYLLLSAYNTEYVGSTALHNYYSYEIATGNLLFLGSITAYNYDYFEPWLNNYQILYVAEDVHYAEYFLLDVRHSNSLESLLGGEFVRRRENPARLEELVSHSLVSRRTNLVEHLPCTLNIVDLASLESYNYTLGYSCGGVFSPNAYQYFYVAYDAEPSNPSSLNFIDLRTDSSTFVMDGEIEALESVSPDGRYAAVVTDNNGIINRATHEDTQFFIWLETQSPMLSFVDISSGEIVYEMPYSDTFSRWDWDYGQVDYGRDGNFIPYMAARWLNESTAIVEQLSSETGKPFYVLLKFNETGIEARELDANVELILVDSPYLIISETQEDNSILYSLYNWETQEQQVLFINPYPDDYNYQLRPEENNLIGLQISVGVGSWESWEYYLLDLNLEIASVYSAHS